MVRTLETPAGQQQVVLAEGVRLLMTYRETEPFVNMKIEKPRNYPDAKQVLVENLKKIGSDSTGMEPFVHNRDAVLDLYATNRKQLEGGVLSIYELFNDSDQTVTTIYFLNAEPADRKFSSVEQYRAIRDEFLKAYTSCVVKSTPTAK